MVDTNITRIEDLPPIPPQSIPLAPKKYAVQSILGLQVDAKGPAPESKLWFTSPVSYALGDLYDGQLY